MHNPNPKFVRKHGLPQVLEAVYNAFDPAATRRNLIKEGRKAPTRCRGFRVERLSTLIPASMAIISKMNLATGLVLCSATDLAHMCGLVTTGEKGVKSIARCTRTLDELRRIEAIDYERGRFNPDEGVCDPLCIVVKPKFWELIGQDPAYMAKKQLNALLYVKKKLRGAAFGVDVSDLDALEYRKILHADLCEQNRRRNSEGRQKAKAANDARRADHKAKKHGQKKAQPRRTIEQRSFNFPTAPTVTERMQAQIAAILTGEPPNLH